MCFWASYIISYLIFLQELEFHFGLYLQVFNQGNMVSCNACNLA